jgi:tetratricopeptide (TPR) repeat protein
MKRGVGVIKWRLAIVLVVMAALCSQADAARRIQCEVTVRERQSTKDEKQTLIEKRDFAILEGVKTTTFLVNFTLDLTVRYNDSGRFDCEFAVYTLPPQTQTFFKKFTSDAGGAYFLDDIVGKEGSIYRISLSPLGVDSNGIDPASCNYDFRKDGVWDFDPSAHSDFYFISKSLADARWNQLRDFVEQGHKEFKSRFQFIFPGKTNYFLSPCALPQVLWDPRLGYAIDPSRGNCFTLYSAEQNTVDPMPTLLLQIYRHMGYAPPILAEGLAGYLDFPHYYAMKLRAVNKMPPLSGMLKSVDYYNLPELENLSAAASFVKYIIDVYTYNRFDRLYHMATDLTIKDAFKTVYNKPLETLETEWHQMLDTLTFKNGQYRYFYEREQFLNRRQGMAMFLKEYMARISNRTDSLYAFSENGWNHYMQGNYDSARVYFDRLITLAPNNGSYLLTMGNLLVIAGQYDSARVMLRRALASDTSNQTGIFKIGETFYWQNNMDSAQAYFLRDVKEDKSPLSQAVSHIELGEMVLGKGDSSAAKDHFARAIGAMQNVLPMGPAEPAYLLRLGQAQMGFDLANQAPLTDARTTLESALFFETQPTRTVFITRILFELGRVADLEGKRQEALSYYQRALAMPLQADFAAQIRQYVAKPFTGFGK